MSGQIQVVVQANVDILVAEQAEEFGFHGIAAGRGPVIHVAFHAALLDTLTG
jgi:hypothetical protein